MRKAIILFSVFLLFVMGLFSANQEAYTKTNTAYFSNPFFMLDNSMAIGDGKWVTNFHDGGISIGTYFSTLDSLSTYYTEYIDFSLFDGQTIYFTYNYYSAGNTSDSLTIVPQGKQMVANGQTISTDLMTTGIVAIAHSSGDSAVQTTMTLARFLPDVRFKIVPTSGTGLPAGAQNNRAGGILKLSFYCKITDYVPETIPMTRKR